MKDRYHIESNGESLHVYDREKGGEGYMTLVGHFPMEALPSILKELQPAPKQQPAPKPNGHPPSWSLVIADMKERNALGTEKYGTPLQPYNGRDSLQDAYEEILDLAVYLRNHLEEHKSKDHYSRCEPL